LGEHLRRHDEPVLAERRGEGAVVARDVGADEIHGR
jgi:hypothetical protein